jgi:hypothetical protein
MKRRLIYVGCATALAVLLIQMATTGSGRAVWSVLGTEAQVERLKTQFADWAGRMWFQCEDFAADLSYQWSRPPVAVRAASHDPLLVEAALGADLKQNPLIHVAEDDS